MEQEGVKEVQRRLRHQAFTEFCCEAFVTCDVTIADLGKKLKFTYIQV